MAFQATQDEVDPDLGVGHDPGGDRGPRSGVRGVRSWPNSAAPRDLHDRLLRLEGMRAAPGDSGTSVAPATLHPVTADELRRALPKNVALVEFVTGLGGEPTTVFVLTPDTERAFVTDPVDSLTPEINRLTTLLATDGDPNTLARRLGASLLDAAIASLSPATTTLLLVPDGALHRLPFDALLLDDGKRVFERYATAVVPSASVALALWRRPARHGPTTLWPSAIRRSPAGSSPTMAPRSCVPRSPPPVVCPDFAHPARKPGVPPRLPIRRASCCGRRRAKRGSREPGWTDSGSSISRPTRWWTSASSARTALALSAGEGEDGFVGPGDLAALSMPADLVVLSACRTAGGRLVRGEGLQGLTAPLLAAGARSVLATQWPIEDRTAGRMTEHFLSRPRRRRDLRPRHSSRREWKLMRAGVSARQWGAFVLVGDPTIRIPLHVPPSRGWIWALGAAVLVVLVGFALVRRSRETR
jgi:hypothetical protein